MSNEKTKEVQNFLAKTAKEKETPPDQQLMFDPTTGELAVQNKNEQPTNPDAVVADQMAEEGFFFRNSFGVYARRPSSNNVSQVENIKNRSSFCGGFWIR